MFKINDRVTVLVYNELPKAKRKTGIGKVCGKSGRIIDIALSAATNEYYYTVKIDGFKSESSIKFTDDMFVKEKEKTFHFEVITERNIVIARLLDEEDNIIAEGHGHIFNSTSAERYAQAASYAFTKLWHTFPNKPPRTRKTSSSFPVVKTTT